MLILNAGISHNSKDWLMWLTIESERTKKRLSLERRYWFNSKLERCLVIGSYLELQSLDFSLIYMDRKLRNRPTMFMNIGRPKSTIFKFQVWPQKRSQNLFCNPAQTLLSLLPIAGVLEGQMTYNLVGGSIWQFPTTFMKTTCSNADVSNDISSRQELKGYPPRPPEALLSSLAISGALVIQMLWHFMGGKIRWFPTTFMRNTLPNSDWINVISSIQNAWVLLSTKST